MKTREKIIETALNLFNEKGYANVGVREIARNLGISPGNLSYHFSRKEDILFVLAKKHSLNNDRSFEDFFETEATLENFLLLMLRIMKSQYLHRGALLELSLLSRDIQTEDRLQYAQTSKRRQDDLKHILELLVTNEHLEADGKDIRFLISFLRLFARFAMQEAFLLNKRPKENEILNQYINMLAKQMSLFSTTKGKKSIHHFRKSYLSS